MKKIITYSIFVFGLVFFSWAVASAGGIPAPVSTSSSFEPVNEKAVRSQSDTLSASIDEYNANRDVPDAPPTDDFNTYGGQLCHKKGYKCMSIAQGETWANLWRNEHTREIVMRLNRTNVALRYRKWVVVPEHLKNIDYLALSPLPMHTKPTGKRLLLVDLPVFAFGAYDAKGNLVYWGPANGGKTYCDGTHEDCRSAAGTFHIYRIQGADCKSSKYPLDRNGGAPMPYCMHYYKGYAIHGSTLSGFVNGSEGCIRLFNDDAKWLNEDFVKLGTEVIVKR